MLKHLFVDNFRTLVNFNIDLGSLTLLLGPNGAGKTTVLDVIRRLRRFACEDGTTHDLFPISTLTRWQKQTVQTFELGVSEGQDAYVYHLEIEHDPALQRCRVKSERLTYGTQILFESKLEGMQLHAQLYRDGGSTGPEMLTDWTRSGVAWIVPTPINKRLTRFKEIMRRVQVCRFDPLAMTARSEQETPVLDANAANFVGWLRQVTGLDLEFAGRLRPVLEEVIDGYDGLTLQPDGEDARILKIRFRAKDAQDSPLGSYECRFDEISDGQRLLLVLYSLLAASQNTTLCLDEPENFLALREVQPWLDALMSRTETNESQAVLVSHHPELINALAVGHGRWLDRTSGGPTRCQPITEDGSGLPISELVARGWLNA